MGIVPERRNEQGWLSSALHFPQCDKFRSRFDSEYGQLGNNSNTSSSTPVQVLGGARGGTYLSNITAIAAGRYHSFALSASGTVFARGYNGDGELGNNSSTSSSTPVQVRGGAQGGTYLTNVTAIAGGF